MGIIAGCAAGYKYPDSSQYNEEAARFENPEPIERPGFMETLNIAWKFFFDKPATVEPNQPIPIVPVTASQLAEEEASTVIYRLGHSTILLSLEGRHWLIDPVFSERASPFTWAGPKRFHAPPISLDDLPEIDGVIISHDHYDHLDEASIRQLSGKTTQFIVPVGVDKHLLSWGVDSSAITALDWWQQTTVGPVSVTATPARHFSGRGLTDGNHSLWASWAIKTPFHHLYFSGDSGYSPHFKEIGERLGPFDITMMENGAYNEMWAAVHMTPEESIQAHKDVKGKLMVPIHNGTFDLALHPWYEPFDRVADLSWEHTVHIATPKMGERLEVGTRRTNELWWKPVKSAQIEGLKPAQDHL